MEHLSDQPCFTFTAPFHVETVEIKGQQRLFLEGIISSTHLDLVNDIVTKNCLESMQKQIISKNLKLDIQHEAFRGDSQEEKEINKTTIPAGKMFDATVQAIEKNQFALIVKSELNPFRENYEEIKGSVQEGFLDAYSIAFLPTKEITKEVNGKIVRLLDDVILLNVALTGNPVNTHAANQEVFMKAILSLEDYKKEKKDNPDIEGKLEVKAGVSRPPTKPIREPEDEEEEKGKKKYKEYEEDGKHIHNEKLPMGEHSHPYIEERIQADVRYLHERISNILANSEEPVLMLSKDKELKAHHDHISDNLIKFREVKQMSEEETKRLEALKKEEEEAAEAAAKEEAEKEKAEAKVEAEKKEAEKEAEEEAKKKEDEKSKEEVKSLNEKIEAMEKEMVEVKKLLKIPVRKSMSENIDPNKKSDEKSQDPLDLLR